MNSFKQFANSTLQKISKISKISQIPKLDAREKEVICNQLLHCRPIITITHRIEQMFNKTISHADLIKIADECLIKHGIHIPTEILITPSGHTQSKYTVYKTIINLLRQGNSIDIISRTVRLSPQQIREILKIAKLFLN